MDKTRALIGAIIFFVSCETAGAYCTGNSDCSGDKVCVHGVCKAPETTSDSEKSKKKKKTTNKPLVFADPKNSSADNALFKPWRLDANIGMANSPQGTACTSCTASQDYGWGGALGFGFGIMYFFSPNSALRVDYEHLEYDLQDSKTIERELVPLSIRFYEKKPIKQNSSFVELGYLTSTDTESSVANKATGYDLGVGYEWREQRNKYSGWVFHIYHLVDQDNLSNDTMTLNYYVQLF